MILCVWGFPNKVMALQFEFAWQHPNICRNVREKVEHLEFCRTNGNGRQRPVFGVMQNLEVLIEMLKATPYSRMPLRLHFLDEGVWNQLPKMPAAQALPTHMNKNQGSFDDLEQQCHESMMVIPVTSSVCAKCKEKWKVGDRLVSCPHCECPLHVTCAAMLCSKSTNTKQLMPDEPACCPQCTRSSEWMVLVRSHRTWMEDMEVQEQQESDSEASDESSDVQVLSQDSQVATPVSPTRDAEIGSKRKEASQSEPCANLNGKAAKRSPATPLGDGRADMPERPASSADKETEVEQTSVEGDRWFRVEGHLHLGLGLTLGKIYAAADLKRKCKGDQEKLKKLLEMMSSEELLKEVAKPPESPRLQVPSLRERLEAKRKMTLPLP